MNTHNRASISQDEALKIVLQHAEIFDIETCPLELSSARVLAEDVCADMNMPPFNKSAMDGYACRKQDEGNALEIVETIAAGNSPTKEIGKNQCAKIMTGAEIPNGADHVVMKEDVETVDDSTIHVLKPYGKSNICIEGEDVKKGALILEKGTLLDARHIAVLAAFGKPQVKVYQKPLVGILVSGNELIEPNSIPQKGQIRNSNGWQMQAQVKSTNVRVMNFGISKDSKEALHESIEEALEEVDILVLAGGVSVGDFDFVPVIINDLGFDTHFQKLDTKPGKHTWFATRNNQSIFALPGNPVSAYMQLELLVKPFIYKTLGHAYSPKKAAYRLAETFTRKKTQRMECVPVKVNPDFTISTVKTNGSADSLSLTLADGFIEIPKGENTIANDRFVDVRFF